MKITSIASSQSIQQDFALRDIPLAKYRECWSCHREKQLNLGFYPIINRRVPFPHPGEKPSSSQKKSFLHAYPLKYKRPLGAILGIKYTRLSTLITPNPLTCSSAFHPVIITGHPHETLGFSIPKTRKGSPNRALREHAGLLHL